MMGTVRCDLHVHSRHSPDSQLPLAAIVPQLGLAGLQGFALTDHNSIAGHAELRELERAHPNLRLIPGVELSTAEGHLLVYGIDELPPVRRTLLETLDWVRSHGAVAALAHPFRWAHGVGKRLARTAPVVAIETANGHNSELANARAELLAAQRGVGATGGSDAHAPADVGRAFTEFPDDTSSVEDALRAISHARTRAAGLSLRFGERLRLGMRTTLRRASRGFRPI